MQQKQFQSKLRLLSLLLCIVLIAAMALYTMGCNDDQSGNDGATSQETTAANTTGPFQSQVTVKGEGNTAFYFSVVNAAGEETKFEIRTDKTVVGDALQELELIAGEDGAYGLYVKTVNGITLDYDTDGKYWAFYINGEYAMSGVDITDITAGATYTFRVE